MQMHLLTSELSTDDRLDANAIAQACASLIDQDHEIMTRLMHACA